MKIYKFVGTVTRHISPIFAKDIIAYLQKIQGDFLIKTYNKSFDMRSILGLVSLNYLDSQVNQLQLSVIFYTMHCLIQT